MSLSALTVKQPWAHMITRCGKDVENRRYPSPRWLGELAIHAGARSGWDDGGEWSPLVREAWDGWAAMLPRPYADPLHRDNALITLSAVVALAEGVACHHSDDCQYRRPPYGGCSKWCARGQFHWSWKALHVLAEPVPCRGYQKLWTVPEEVERAIRARLGESNE